MRKLKKEIQTRVKAVKGNLDAVLLGLKSSKLEQLVTKLEGTRKRLEREGDMAMGLALQVLGRVRSVKDSLARATGTKAVAKKAKAKKTTKARKPAPKKKSTSKGAASQRH